MATYNISVLSTSSSGNGYRFSGTDKNGTISSSTNNPTINITAGDTINFTFSNSTSHPFTISGTTISGESATGGYYSTPTAESYTFSSTMTYTYVCNVHSSMTRINYSISSFSHNYNNHNCASSYYHHHYHYYHSSASNNNHYYNHYVCPYYNHNNDDYNYRISNCNYNHHNHRSSGSNCNHNHYNDCGSRPNCRYNHYNYYDFSTVLF